MKQKKLVILTIAKLTDNKTSGINTNVPIYVKILNNYCHSACLDCGNTKDNNFNGYENYFKFYLIHIISRGARTNDHQLP